jgi:hypothetical protein
VNQVSPHLQPQSSVQNPKVASNQFNQFQEPLNNPQQPRPFQSQQPQKFERPNPFKQPQPFEQPNAFKQPQQPQKVQSPKNFQQPAQPNQFNQFQFQKPQQPQQSEEDNQFQFQQPQKFQQPLKTNEPEQSRPIESEQSQQHNNLPVKFGLSAQTERTFTFPSLPPFQDIPNQITNQISNLNPFRPQKPLEQPQESDVINGAGDILPINLPSTTKRPGFFQNFPNLPSFPGFGKGHDSSPTNDNPVIISPHKPGAQCGIINEVNSTIYHYSALTLSN